MVGEQSVERAGIRPGSVVRDFVARDVNDIDVEVRFAGGLPTLLYVFSPVCAWCDSNHENIVALATMLSTQFRIIGLADSAYGPDLMAGYLRTYPLPFDVLFLDPVTAGLDFSLTPQTVVVRADDGMVRHAWGGALFGRRLSHAEYVFGVRLPGLSAVPAMEETELERACWSDHGVTIEGGVARVQRILSVCRAGQWVRLMGQG